MTEADLGRFARNYIEFGQYTDYLFPSIGCRFIAVNNGIDTMSTDGSNDVMCFLNLFNEFYSRDTSKKVRAVKKACAEDSKFMGTYAPYGYKRDPENKHHLIIDEETAPIVRRMFAMRASGESYCSITDALNTDKIIPPRVRYYQNCGRIDPRHVNHLWANETVKSIIENEMYMGKNIYGRRVRPRIGDAHTVNVPSESWVVVEDSHEALVTPELFEKAQKQLRNYQEHWYKPCADRPLRGKVYCGICGHAMTRRNNKEAEYFCKTPTVTDSYS